MAGVERKQSVLLVDADPQSTTRTWAEVATEQGHPTPTVVAMGSTMHQKGQLPKVAKQFDITIIDGPPRHNDVQRSMLMVADKVVIPCGPSASDAWALAATLELLNEARIIRQKLDARILITRVKAGTAIGKGARDALKESGLPILKTELGDRVAYQEALAAGQGVTGYAPMDKSALEIKKLYREITR